MHGNEWFSLKGESIIFSLTNVTVAVGLTAAQYYDFTWVFWMLLQKCWQLDRWANLGTDFPGTPLDSVRSKALLRSFPCTQEDLNLLTPYSYTVLLRTSSCRSIHTLRKQSLTPVGGPTPWHYTEYTPFCAPHHSILVVCLWLMSHCTFKAHCDSMWGSQRWKKESLFPFLRKGCKVNTLMCKS